MDDLVELVNRIQRSCTLLEDHGAATDTLSLPTLWSSLPSVVVVGGQSSGKSSVLESIVGRDFLPRGSGIVTRRPLVVQLHKTDGTEAEYAEFLHIPKKRFSDFCAVRREIEEETDRVTRHTKQISPRPIHLSIYSPHVVNLTLIDLPGLTNIAVGGQSDTVVAEIENLVRSYAAKPNSLILAISPANQDIATSDAIKLAHDVDPSGHRTYGVLTKLDLMDKGTNARDVLEGRAYRLEQPWVGVINRSQADINMGIDMMAARKKEREYFASSSDYKHLEGRMGSEYLAKLLSKRLKDVIKAKLPSIQSLTNRTIVELETELKSYGNPVFVDAGERLYKILEICRAFDCIFKDHLEGRRAGGEQIYLVFEKNLPAALKSLPFDGQLSLQNIRKVISEADGYLPHLVAPEQGYRRLIERSLSYFKPPAEATVNRVHHILKGLVQKSISETEGLKHCPNLRAEIYAAATESLERFRTDSMQTALRLVEMESSYLTVDFFRRLPQEVERSGNATESIFDRYTEAHLRRIGSNVLSYVRMVCETFKNSIPKAVVHCQVREAKNALLDHFYITIGKKEANQLASLLDEDPRAVVQREACANRLELFRNARDEIDAVVWT